MPLKPLKRSSQGPRLEVVTVLVRLLGIGQETLHLQLVALPRRPHQVLAARLRDALRQAGGPGAKGILQSHEIAIERQGLFRLQRLPTMAMLQQGPPGVVIYLLYIRENSSIDLGTVVT